MSAPPSQVAWEMTGLSRVGCLASAPSAAVEGFTQWRPKPPVASDASGPSVVSSRPCPFRRWNAHGHKHVREQLLVEETRPVKLNPWLPLHHSGQMSIGLGLVAVVDNLAGLEAPAQLAGSRGRLERACRPTVTLTTRVDVRRLSCGSKAGDRLES